MAVVVISNNTDLDAGESTFLTCVGYGDPGVDISWLFNGFPIINTSLVATYEDNFIIGGRLHQRSFLQLCSPTVLANGEYTCVADNGVISANASTQLIVTG